VAFFGVFVVADCLVVVVVVIRIVSRKGALEFLFAVVCSLVFGSALPACLPKDLSRVSHGQTTVTVHVIYIYNNHSSFNLSLLSPSCPDARERSNFATTAVCICFEALSAFLV